MPEEWISLFGIHLSQAAECKLMGNALAREHNDHHNTLLFITVFRAHHTFYVSLPQVEEDLSWFHRLTIQKKVQV